MKKFFAQLRPLERRLAVGVLVVFILVLNWVFIWPHYSDWSDLRSRFEVAKQKLALYQTTILQTSNYEAQVKVFESQGDVVAPEDQSINFLRTIQSQAQASGVGMGSMGRPSTRTNDAFFVEQIQNINVTATDEQLVDFLYKLGSDASMIRVRDLELQPDPPHQKLNANIRLVASYRRNAPASLENRNRKGTMKTTRLRHAPARRAIKTLTQCKMKTIHLRRAMARHATLVLILFLTGLNLWAQTPTTPLPGPVRPRPRAATNNPAGAPATGSAIATTAPGTAVSPDNTGGTEGEGAGITFTYDGVDVEQVLDVYSDLVGRTLIEGQVPKASIMLKTQSPLTRPEAIEALQAVLALNGITFVNIGEKFAKVVTPEQAGGAGGMVDTNDAANLPEMGPYVTHIVQLKYVKPSVMGPIIQPFGKLANSITPIDDNYILVIRDYAENVKRMLEMIAKIDVSVPAVYVSEVIPIRYAQADDIASALNSLGGGGGSTVSVGSSTSASPINGISAQPHRRNDVGRNGIHDPTRRQRTTRPPARLASRARPRRIPTARRPAPRQPCSRGC